MDSGNLGESSGGLSGLPAKRRRGRPPKDPSRKQAEAAQVFHGFGAKPHLPQTADRSVGQEGEVGQTVTGVVEAAFEAGYLLSVRIGDSNTNLKGIVFKPGHSVPVTPENDIAPHLPMIRRKDIHFATGNQGQTHGQKVGMKTAATVPAKRKYKSRKSLASIQPTGANGIFTPLILQPVNIPSGMPNSDHGDEPVHMVEPLSMLPPDQSVPAGQIFMSTQGYSNHQVAPASEQEDGSLNEATSEEKSKQPMTPTDVDTPGSSHSSDTKTEDGKETAKSSPEDSGIVSKQELGNTNELFFTESLPVPSTPVVKPFFNYGTGNMTELLQAQENMKDTPVQFAEQPSFSTGFEVTEQPSFSTGFEYFEPTMGFDPKNQVPNAGDDKHM